MERNATIAIWWELILVFRGVIECDNVRESVSRFRKTVREQLKRTVDSWMNLKRKTLADQFEWIYDYVDGLLFLLIKNSEKAQIQAIVLDWEVR